MVGQDKKEDLGSKGLFRQSSCLHLAFVCYNLFFFLPLIDKNALVLSVFLKRICVTYVQIRSKNCIFIRFLG